MDAFAVALLALALIFIPGLFLFVGLLTIGFARATVRGYTWQGAFGIFFVCAVAVGVVAFGTIEAESAGPWSFSARFASVFLVPCAILSYLPRRVRRRHFGANRVSFPYRGAGLVLGSLTAAGWVALVAEGWWIGDATLGKSLAALLFAPVLGFSVYRVFKALYEPGKAVSSFDEVLVADPRPSVIYIRSFLQDRAVFVQGDRSRYGAYSQKPFLTNKQVVVHIELSKYLETSVRQHVGPLIALGNPLDYFPPAGAVRAYVRDEAWTAEFDRLARQSACLIAGIGTTSSLLWELRFLRETNMHTKLVLVTRHASVPRHDTWLSKFYRRAIGVGPEPTWGDLVQVMTSLGYVVPADEPEDGSVLGFDAAARAQLITTGADLPDDFVKPIVEWLGSTRNSDSSLPVKSPSEHS